MFPRTHRASMLAHLDSFYWWLPRRTKKAQEWFFQVTTGPLPCFRWYFHRERSRGERYMNYHEDDWDAVEGVMGE